MVGEYELVQRHLSDISHWILCAVLLITWPVSAKETAVISTTDETMAFNNFSNEVVLVKQPSAGRAEEITYYQVKGTPRKVALSNRLIVETTANITREDIYHYHPQVSKVTVLFKGSDRRYYSLSLKNANKLPLVLGSPRALQDKNPTSGITLVQPDILQLKTSAEVTPAFNRTSPYISLVDIPSLWVNTKLLSEHPDISLSQLSQAWKLITKTKQTKISH